MTTNLKDISIIKDELNSYISINKELKLND